jgi:tetratricopeptide (TPR) repeat protein
VESSSPTREQQLAEIANRQRQGPLDEASNDLADNRLADAERKIRSYLGEHPDDPAALRLLAELAIKIGRKRDARALLERVLEIAPDYDDARTELVRLLRDEPANALMHLDLLLAKDPANRSHLERRAELLARTGREEEALAIIQPLLAETPDGSLHLLAAQWLRALGRTDEAIAALRHATHIPASTGHAWWGLANLKTVSLSDADIAKMRDALRGDNLGDDNRALIHFALGKAFEDHGDPEQAFRNYSEANRLQRAAAPYDATQIETLVRKSVVAFTKPFFEGRADNGCKAEGPIFIVGMHRAGSTLLEQILSSHSKIEGTGELPYIGNLARGLRRSESEPPEALVDQLLAVDPAKFSLAGESYLRSAAAHRHTDQPFFIDKNSGNWSLIPLIHLMLPNARIIDMRRDPVDCCFSIFKQRFALGRGFNDLGEIGRYYAAYVAMMDHFDEVLPGRVIRLRYEELVAQPEAEVRRVLERLGLEFESGCMNFHESKRAVRTPSSEQVRRPIHRSGIGASRPFDPWLGPLKEALAPVLNPA